MRHRRATLRSDINPSKHAMKCFAKEASSGEYKPIADPDNGSFDRARFFGGIERGYLTKRGDEFPRHQKRTGKGLGLETSGGLTTVVI